MQTFSQLQDTTYSHLLWTFGNTVAVSTPTHRICSNVHLCTLVPNGIFLAGSHCHLLTLWSASWKAAVFFVQKTNLLQMFIWREEGECLHSLYSPANVFKGLEVLSTWLLGFYDFWIHSLFLLFSVELPQHFESSRQACFMFKTSSQWSLWSGYDCRGAREIFTTP